MKPEEFHRRGLLTCAILSTFFFVGAIFGWGPMQLLLEEQGIFACTTTATTTSTSCPEQTTRLIQINFVASATQVTAPIWGQFLDHYGAPSTFGLVVSFVVSGILVLLLTMRFNDSDNSSWGVYVGFILLALGSWCGGLLMVPTGLYFTGTTRNRVIILLNALFDSSAMTYWILWSVAEYMNVDLVGVLGLYLGIAVVLFVPGVYFWWVAVPQRDEEEDTEENRIPSNANDNGKESVPTTDETETSQRRRVVETPNQTVEEDIQLGSRNNSSHREETNGTSTSLHDDNDDNDRPTDQEDDYVLVAQRPPRQQLLANPTLLLFAFFGIQVGINLWTLTTTRDFLAHLGDDELNNRYLTIFTLLTPVSLLGTPAVDWALRRFGYPGAFQVINGLSLGSLVIRVSSTNLNVQILGFVLFSFYRSFFFGVTFSYVPTLLSADMVGRMSGLLYLISGIASFLNIPMARLAIQRHEGDFFRTNVIYTLLVAPCILAAWGMGRADQLERRCKSERC